MDIDSILKYKEEHVNCIYYANDNTCKLAVLKIRNEKIFVKQDHEKSTLYFVLEGTVRLGLDKGQKQCIEAGHFFLSEVGYTSYIQAEGAVMMITCDITNAISFCNEYSFRALMKFYQSNKKKLKLSDKKLAYLPIVPLLAEELQTICHLLQSGMKCLYMQNMKVEMLLLILRAFYTREDLALVFAPLLTEELDFKRSILLSYNPKNNVQDMIVHSGLSQSTFSRKFIKTFGVAPKQYLMQRKRSELLRDLITSSVSIKDLARNYGMTPNYITKFIYQNFGMTPTELRENQNELHALSCVSVVQKKQE